MLTRFVLASSLLLASCGLLSPVSAREGWAGRPLVCDPAQIEGQELSACQNWISRVKQPDSGVSCCGEGDAFIADGVEVDANGNTVAIISQDYPSGTYDDGEGDTYTTKDMRAGTRIIIPKEKINHAYDNGGNPSGHGIVFMNTDRVVLCYFGPTLAAVPGQRFAAQ